MPRNASGTYSLPAGNPVVTGTTIASSWANTTLDDLKAEMTDSVSRSAKGGMLGPLALVDGAVGVPALSFNNELSSGLYRPAANKLALVLVGAEQLRLTTAATEPAVKFTSPQAAAGAQTDLVLNTTNTRTAGNLLQVQNNTSARLTLGYAGDLAIAGTALSITGASAILEATAANVGLTLKGNRSAADAGTDVVLNGSVTRTAGNLLDVQNNTTSRMWVDFSGSVGLAGSSANFVSIASATTNLSLRLVGNRSAADTGFADVIFSSSVTRTAGNILQVANAGLDNDIFKVSFDGKVIIGSSQQILAFNSNTGLTIKGNRNAADAGTDIILASTATRTAGLLLDVQNNATSKFSVDFNGDFNAVTASATAGTNWTINSQSLRRVGGVVFFRIDLLAGAAPSTTCATIPAGHRPAGTACALAVNQAIGTGITKAAANSAGNVVLNAAANGDVVVLSGTWATYA